MKDTIIFGSSIDTTFEEDIQAYNNKNHKKMNSSDLEKNGLNNFCENSSLVLKFFCI